MHHTSFTVVSGLSVVLVLLPLPWHWRAKNIGTLLNILWLFIGNLNYFVNSIKWWNNYSQPHPVWCDISAKVSQAVGPGIVCSTLCITRRLAAIASARSTLQGAAQRRRALMIDLSIGIGIPLLLCASTVVSQGHRYDVLEGVGCYAAEYVALPYIFLYMMWPVVITTISAVLGCRAAWLFLKQRLQFNAILKTSHSGLNTSRFLRLMALAFSDLLLTLPLSIYLLVLASRALVPWISWSHVHEDFSHVELFTADSLYVASNLEARFELPRWLFCLGACFFFLFFGVTDDAIKEYTKWCQAAWTLLRRKRIDGPAKTSPAYVPKLGSFMEAVASDDRSFGRREDTSADDFAIDSSAPGVRAAGINVKIDREIV